MAKNCFDIFIKNNPDIHDYLKSKSGVDFNGGNEGRKEYIKAAKDLQGHILNSIHDVYSQIGVEGFKPREISSLREPTIEEKLKDINAGNLVTFTYDKESDIPDILKDKVSSFGETNGKKIFRVTLSKVEADYLLNESQNKEPLPSKEVSTVQLSDEATELLRKIDQEGYVPSFTHDPINKIAEDNGIILGAKPRLDDFIKALKQKQLSSSKDQNINTNTPKEKQSSITVIPPSENRPPNIVEPIKPNEPVIENNPPKEPPPTDNKAGNGKKEYPPNQRKFTQQVLKDKKILPKEEIAKKLDYVRQTNAMSIKEATDIVDQVGVDEAFDLIVHDKDLKPAVRVTLGQMVIKKFNTLASEAKDQETKDYYWDKTIQAADFVTEKLATEPGQMIQAFSLYSRLSPEAQLRSAIKDVKKQSKERMQKRKKDVDNLGDKLKQVNEETAEEITKSKKVKATVDKVESNTIAKAKDKIQKAKDRREKIIAKYKSEKGTSLYSGVGLTKEGIEFVGDLAKTYIDEGIANIEIIAEKIRTHLKNATQKEPDETVNKNITEILQPLIENVQNKKIATGLKELENEVGKIVKEHYTVPESSKQKLVDKFIEQTGLEKEDAEQLARTIETEFDNIATRKKNDILNSEKERFDRIQNALGGAKKVEKKTLQDDVIKYSNLGAFDNADLLNMLSEKLGTGSLTQEQGKEIQRLAEKIEKAPEGSPKNDAVQDLLTYRANLKGNKWGDIAQGVWYANVLSGYATHVKNIVSTFFNGMSFFAVEAARNPKSIPVLLYGGVKGVKRGAVEAWHTLTTGRSPIHVSKVEVPQVLERIKFKGGLLNPFNYLKYVGRMMVAEDVLQFQGLKEMRATQLAYREAKKMGISNPLSPKVWKIINEKLLNTPERLAEAQDQVKLEGLKGTEASRRTYELMEQSRPIQMQEDAYGFAAKGTFNHDTEGTLGALSDSVSRFIDNSLEIGGAKPLRFLIPFTRIITNVANNTLDFSPIGLVRGAAGKRGLLASEASGKKREMSKEERQQTLIKAALGTASMAALYALSKNGTIQVTGAGPSDLKKRLQLIQEGWQAYSIKIGKTYYSYKLTPMVFAWGLVGNIRDHEEYDKNADSEGLAQRTALAAWDGVKLLGDMTWVSSAAPVMSAISADNAGQAGAELSNTGKGIVKGFVLPNAYTQAAEKTEQLFHIPQKQANNLYETLIMNVPIARNSLNDKINALGDPVIKDVDLLTSKENTDPIWKYLLDKKGWVAPVNKHTIIVFDNKTKQDRPITDDEYYEFSKLRGKKIKEGISDIIKNGALVKEGDEYVQKSANELNSFQLNKVLTPIETQATKDTKRELFSKDSDF